MPREPVQPPGAAAVPSTTLAARGSSSSNPATSSLAFRMKRLGSGGGARRALTALGSNDTQLNLRLAKSLLTISQEKFAKKWDFDPVREVPLAQGRFYWTPTALSTKASLECGLHGPSSNCCCMLTCPGSGSKSSSVLGSHDLAVAEAEDNAAALRTCLTLPGARSSRATSDTSTITVTSLGQYPLVTAAAVATSAEPRVPPLHPEGGGPQCMPDTTAASAKAKPSAVTGPSSSGSSIGVTSSKELPTALVDKERPVEAVGDATTSGLLPTTPVVVDNERTSEGGVVSDAKLSLHVATVVVDNERGAPDAVQDNQCQCIDSPTDVERPPRQQQTTQQPLTQACITNYLRPRKRSSAHLQEVVHSSKAKKVLLAA